MALFDEEPIRSEKPQLLDELSIEELEDRIAGLKAAIAACEAEIDKKRQQKTAADALFGGKN